MSAYSDRVIADGASHYWRLNESSGTTAVDAVAGNNGTIAGGVTLGVPGAVTDGTTAMTFNGTTGIITTATPVTTPIACTVECWVKVATAVTSAFMPFVTNQGPAATGEAIYLGSQQASGQPAAAFGTEGESIVGVKDVRDGLWHHLVLVLNGTNAFLYVDGVLDRGATPYPRAVAGVGVLTIGRDQPASGVFLNGSIDEVAIYPTALSAPTIAAHYAVGAAVGGASRVRWSIDQGGDVESINVWKPVTPSDTVDLPGGVTKGIWVGGSGDVAAVMQNGTAQVLAGVPAGTWLPLAVRRINVAGTSATNLVALYGA